MHATHAVIIPPSPRPVLLWLAVAAVCATLLSLDSVTLLSLWRRLSRPWRLGLAALGGGALGGGLTGRILAAYHDLAPIGACYAHGCEGFFPLLTNAVAVALILSCLLAAFTCASVVAALILSASEREGRPAAPGGPAADIGRAVSLLLFTAVADAGAYWMIDGIAN